MEKEIIKKLKLELLNSLKHDTDKWTVSHYNTEIYSWMTFSSPEYKHIQFVIDENDFCSIYFDGTIRYKLFIMPFSKIDFAIKTMKRSTLQKERLKKINEMQELINKSF